MFTDADLLARFLDKLFHPVRLKPPDPERLPVDVAVLSVDAQFEVPFGKACQTLARKYPKLARKTVPVVFQPELEVLLMQAKEPLERAVGLPPCSSVAPESHSDLKQALADWVARFAPQTKLDTAFRERVAQELDVGPASPLQGLPCYRELADRLLRVMEQA